MSGHPLDRGGHCTPLKKTDSLPKQPAAVNRPQLGVRTHHPLPYPCWGIDWFNLVQALGRQPQPCWVHESGRSCPVLSFPDDTIFYSAELAFSLILNSTCCLTVQKNDVLILPFPPLFCDLSFSPASCELLRPTAMLILSIRNWKTVHLWKKKSPDGRQRWRFELCHLGNSFK